MTFVLRIAGRMNPHEMREHAPHIVEILGFLLGERNVKNSQPAHDEERKRHDRREQIFLVDRHAVLVEIRLIGTRAPAAVENLRRYVRPHARMEQAHLLRVEQRDAGTLEALRARDVHEQLQRPHEPVIRVREQLPGDVEDLRRARRRISLRKTLAQERHAPTE